MFQHNTPAGADIVGDPPGRAGIPGSGPLHRHGLEDLVVRL
jgi:hypothetical protein